MISGSSGPWVRTRSDTMLDGLIGLEAAIAIGSVLAAGVAVALSPLAPLGPVRSVYPARGLSFDWTVLGFGVLVLMIVLERGRRRCWPTRPRRTGSRCRPRIRSTSGARVVASAARAGLSAPAWSGSAWRSSRARAGPRCPCARRCSGRSWPWHSSSRR